VCPEVEKVGNPCLNPLDVGNTAVQVKVIGVLTSHHIMILGVEYYHALTSRTILSELFFHVSSCHMNAI
jgi:hypothetical protein